MTGDTIRKKFLDFFEARGHKVVASSSLVPHDDPTLLFTNAGMVQFKRVFMGEEKREYSRAATCQRCVRAGGKHNDLDNVGYTARHHTFFEMLGNFSFGDYFKEEAIRFAWEFLTREIGIDPGRLWVSVYEEDDEAYRIWERVEDLPKGRIVRMGEKDNFWAMGDTGPCGPCSEIHIDQGEQVPCDNPRCGVECDCDRFLEIWNLVFMQFSRDETGRLTPLPKPSIDTGMGLERIAAVVQGKYNNYDSDLFAPLMERIQDISGVRYHASARSDTAMRVIADHARATAFLVADGVLPSNEGRGYVLRRIMRRAIRFGRTLGLADPFLFQVTGKVVEQMAATYPHLRDARELMDKVVRHEEERFFETLDNGIRILDEEIMRLKREGARVIDGGFIFKLYDTYGFPVDIAKDVAMEHGLTADEAGFNRAMAAQREQSKRSWKGGGVSTVAEGLKPLVEEGHRTRFVGYDTRRATSRIIALLDEEGEKLDRAGEGLRVQVVCEETPFYAESGGQAGDAGEIVGDGFKVAVDNTVYGAEGITVHQGLVVDGAVASGLEVELKVAEGRRQQIACNHTATHLLHAALREVLGEHVKQAGSLVLPERLRFDFTHFSPVTEEELRRIEIIVNDEIRANTHLLVRVLDREEAVRDGAMALFGEKYADRVRVVAIGDFSKELCGGTHVGATGEIGLFKIVSEGGVAAGVRRIEAVTGPVAFARFQEAERLLAELSGQLKAPVEELSLKACRMNERIKELEREVARLAARLSATDLDQAVAQAVEVNGVRVFARQVTIDSPKTLRELGDRVRDKLGSGIAVLGGEYQGKVSLLALVTKDLTNRFHAGKIVKEVAALVNGSGGGRPDMAQAGGTDVKALPQALAKVEEIIAGMS